VLIQWFVADVSVAAFPARALQEKQEKTPLPAEYVENQKAVDGALLGSLRCAGPAVVCLACQSRITKLAVGTGLDLCCDAGVASSVHLCS
jgi:hypothetical protein